MTISTKYSKKNPPPPALVVRAITDAAQTLHDAVPPAAYTDDCAATLAIHDRIKEVEELVKRSIGAA